MLHTYQSAESTSWILRPTLQLRHTPLKSFLRARFDHYSLVLSLRTVLATDPRESSWYKQTGLFYRIQQKPFSLSTAICELANSSTNPTDIITTSSYNVIIDKITDLCRKYPYPSKPTLKRSFCQNMTMKRQMRRRKKSYTGGRLFIHDQRTDQTTSNGYEEIQTNFLYGRQDRRQDSTAILSQFRPHPSTHQPFLETVMGEISAPFRPDKPLLQAMNLLLKISTIHLNTGTLRDKTTSNSQHTLMAW